MSLCAPNAPNAPLCLVTSTTPQDYQDAIHAASGMPGGYTVSEGVDDPGGREKPYRFILMTPDDVMLPLFRLDRGPGGVDVLAVLQSDDPMEEWMDSLGTFSTMGDALIRVAEGHEHSWDVAD